MSYSTKITNLNDSELNSKLIDELEGDDEIEYSDIEDDNEFEEENEEEIKMKQKEVKKIKKDDIPFDYTEKFKDIFKRIKYGLIVMIIVLLVNNKYVDNLLVNISIPRLQVYTQNKIIRDVIKAVLTGLIFIVVKENMVKV